MLINNTIENLKLLRMPAMADGLKHQIEDPNYGSLSFEDRISMLVDQEIVTRQSNRMERNIKSAQLKMPASVEDIDFSSTRQLNKAQILTLAESNWIKSFQNLIITGPTGLGKTYLACALSNAALRHNYSVKFHRFTKLTDEMTVSRVDGRWISLMNALVKVDLLILDDFLIKALNTEQASNILELIEDRAQKSTIFASQLPIDRWHDAIGDPTLADAILDRILAKSTRIELMGPSMRNDQRR